jgi:hypothetical protein
MISSIGVSIVRECRKVDDPILAQPVAVFGVDCILYIYITHTLQLLTIKQISISLWQWLILCHLCDRPLVCSCNKMSIVAIFILPSIRFQRNHFFDVLPLNCIPSGQNTVPQLIRKPLLASVENKKRRSSFTLQSTSETLNTAIQPQRAAFDFVWPPLFHSWRLGAMERD